MSPEVRLINRSLPNTTSDEDERYFEPEGSAEGCASGDCLPEPRASVPEPGASLPESRALLSDAERWRRAVEALRQSSPRHGKSLSYARILGFTQDTVKVVFPPDAAFHRTTVLGLSRALVEGELAKHFGRVVKLVEDTSPAAMASSPKSIAEQEATDRAAREKVIESKVHQHPAVRSVLKHLGGQVEHIQYLDATPADVAPPTADDDPNG